MALTALGSSGEPFHEPFHGPTAAIATQRYHAPRGLCHPERLITAARPVPLDGGRFAIVASSGGSPAHPAWYHNLKAHPVITVEVGPETFTAIAEELTGTARDQLWPELVARYPTLGAHQAKTTRQFPVFVLTRQD